MDGQNIAQLLTPGVLGTFAFAFAKIAREQQLRSAWFQFGAYCAATLAFAANVFLTLAAAPTWLSASAYPLHIAAVALFGAALYDRRKRGVPGVALAGIALVTLCAACTYRFAMQDAWMGTLAMAVGCAVLLGAGVPPLLPARRKADKRLLMLLGGLVAGLVLALAISAPLGSAGFDAAAFSAIVNLLVTVLGMLLALTLIGEYNQRQLDALALASRTDPLTSVLNRRGFEDGAHRAVARCLERGERVCVIVADIDHFKRINDTYGHPAGDEAIRRFAGVLLDAVGRSAMVGRVGGEEFALILPDCDAEIAVHAAEALRLRAEALDLSDVDPGLTLTATFGVAEAERGYEDAFAKADAWLLQGKQEGRNRVVGPAETGAVPRLVAA